MINVKFFKSMFSSSNDCDPRSRHSEILTQVIYRAGLDKHGLKKFLNGKKKIPKWVGEIIRINIYILLYIKWGFPVGSVMKNLPAMQATWVRSLI